MRLKLYAAISHFGWAYVGHNSYGFPVHKRVCYHWITTVVLLPVLSALRRTRLAARKFCGQRWGAAGSVRRHKVRHGLAA